MLESERKRKMISLRISDAEYARLKADLHSYGARNVSDLARLAIQRIVHTPSSAQTDLLAMKLAHLEERVHSLEGDVAAILQGRPKL